MIVGEYEGGGGEHRVYHPLQGEGGAGERLHQPLWGEARNNVGIYVEFNYAKIIIIISWSS